MSEQLELAVEQLDADNLDPVEIEFHGGPLHRQVWDFEKVGWCRYLPIRVTRTIERDNGINRFETDNVNYVWTAVTYPRAHMTPAALKK